MNSELTNWEILMFFTIENLFKKSKKWNFSLNGSCSRGGRHIQYVWKHPETERSPWAVLRDIAIYLPPNPQIFSLHTKIIFSDNFSWERIDEKSEEDEEWGKSWEIVMLTCLTDWVSFHLKYWSVFSFYYDQNLNQNSRKMNKSEEDEEWGKSWEIVMFTCLTDWVSCH